MQQTQVWLDTGLVDGGELLSCTAEGLEPDHDPELLSCPPSDVVHMARPAEVAGEGDTKELGLVDHLKWVIVREV